MPSLRKRLAALKRNKTRTRTHSLAVREGLSRSLLHLISKPASTTPSTTTSSTTDSDLSLSQPSTSIPLASLPSPPLPPSAIPYPPRTCAAPLSTHHRLHCRHVVRTPFLTPCAANCAHVTSHARAAPPPSFTTADAFTCPVCLDAIVAARAAEKLGAFAGVLAKNKGVLLEGEWDVIMAAYERIVVAEEVEERVAAAAWMGGRRWCERAQERDGHLRGCP